MKKIMLLAVATIMATMNASAQYEPGKWSIDVNTGLGASWLTNAEKYNLQGTSLDKQVAPNFKIGLGATYQIIERLGLSAGFYYSMQGQSWETLKLNDTKYENNTLELSYLQIPVMAHLYIVKGLSLNAGVQCGFLFNADLLCHIESKENGRDRTDDVRLDYMDDLEKFDLTIPLGISYEFNQHFVLGAQYNMGLTAVNKKGHVFGKEAKNGVFLLTFGYKHGL